MKLTKLTKWQKIVCFCVMQNCNAIRAFENTYRVGDTFYLQKNIEKPSKVHRERVAKMVKDGILVMSDHRYYEVANEYVEMLKDIPECELLKSIGDK